MPVIDEACKFLGGHVADVVSPRLTESHFSFCTSKPIRKNPLSPFPRQGGGHIARPTTPQCRFAGDFSSSVIWVSSFIVEEYLIFDELLFRDGPENLRGEPTTIVRAGIFRDTPAGGDEGVLSNGHSRRGWRLRLFGHLFEGGAAEVFFPLLGAAEKLSLVKPRRER
jgi:hypothetical protein